MYPHEIGKVTGVYVAKNITKIRTKLKRVLTLKTN